MSSPRSLFLARLTLIPLLMAALPGCGLFRGGSGTKQRLDAPRVVPHHPTNVKPRSMLIEVITDASGAVATVTFQRSSGSEAVDNYAADNIRHTWPAVPSTRFVVEETYSADKGFTDPKMISSTPAP